jgi:hypothetical protein
MMTTEREITPDAYRCARCDKDRPLDDYIVTYADSTSTMVRTTCYSCRLGNAQQTWTQPPLPTTTTNNAQQVTDVFEAWRTLHSNSRATLSKARRHKIVAALRDYPVDEIIEALHGVTRSDWHMGRNPSGVKYTDIVTVLRDPSNIDRFIALQRAATSKSAEAQFLDEA